MDTMIRKALASDLGALVDLSRRTISASYRAFLGDVAVDAFLASGAADRYVQENIGRCSVVLLEGEVVGYAVCQDNAIDLVMIDQAAHRQGLGTALLARCEREAVAHGFRRFEATALAENAAMLEVFHESGFEIR